MKRTTKALYAGVAGLALLTTTGGTFAQWTDSASLRSAAVVTGDLHLGWGDDVVPVTPWAWKLNGESIGGFPGTVEGGAVLEGTTSVVATVRGETLVASLEARHEPGDGAAWPPGIEVDVTLNDGVPLSEIRDGEHGQVPLAVKITFPGDLNGDVSVDLGDVLVTLQQVFDEGAFGAPTSGEEP